MTHRAKLLFGALLGVALFPAGWVAGQAAFVPPENPLETRPAPLTYVVQEATVGRSLSFAAVAEWDLSPVAPNRAVGVVTSVVIGPGTPADAGNVAFTVDLRPVVIAQGEVPMFRELRVGDEGPDVEQLQSFLAATGHFEGDPDGRFGADTASGVRAWQREVGVDPDGHVRPGDLVFVPELPGSFVVGDDIAVGRQVTGGEVALSAVSAIPRFWIPLAPDQRGFITPGMPVVLSLGAGTVEATVARVVEGSDVDGLEAELDGIRCGDRCADLVRVGDRSTFQAQVVLTPEETGPAVPVAAIRSDAGNATFLVGSEGERLTVDVRASANGLAVVDGVRVGTEVRLPYGEPPPAGTADDD
ncbi:MAG: peptidoglycan-binding protein [Nitriliruptorales bacterium]|nr:peptidoglycan-binding protein [Nitriliruptorales bacterium]